MTENNVPIKFRAWDEDKEIFIPDKIKFFDGDLIIFKGEAFGTLGSAVIALVQFTGLFDKDKNEIWEGDLVQINGVVYEVIKKPGVFWLVDAAGNEWSALHVQNFKILEVIGNKYENPELLK